MKKRILIAVIVLFTFIGLRYLKYFFAFVVFGLEAWKNMDIDTATNLLVYSEIILVFLVTYLLFKIKFLDALGLNSKLTEGFKYSTYSMLPMVIGFAFISHFNFRITFTEIHRDLVVAGFFEEFLYRGFVFGILFYRVRLGFLLSVILPSIFFGIGHLYQAKSFEATILIFTFTTLASIGFAWFYTAWKNLWIVIFLHGFMDLAWTGFEIQENVTGSLVVNVFRFATLGLMILFSLRQIKKHPENSIAKKWWRQKVH